MRIGLPLFDCAPDVIAEDASAGIWTQAQGVQFRAGMAERVAPALAVYTSGAPAGPYLATMSINNVAGEFFWIVATVAGIYGTDGAVWFTLTPASGWAATAASVITMHGFNGVAIINDSVGGPFYWSVDRAVRALRLPGWPSGWRVVSMRSHSGFLFGIGRLDMGGIQRVVWSDAAEAGSLPASWQPAADNLAGWVDLLPAVSPCIDGISLGNEFLVFKGESVHAFTFTGGVEVFSVRVRFATVGLASVGGFARGPSERFLFAASHGDVMISDGVSYQSVLTGKAQRTYYDDVLASALGGLIQGATLARLGLSLMAYTPRGGAGMTRALIYDWASGAISWRSLPESRCISEGRAIQDVTRNKWDGDSEAWNKDPTPWNAELVAATGDDVLVGGAGLWLISEQNAEGVADPVYLLKLGASLGNSENQKLIRRVWPRIRGVGRVLVRVGASVEASGPVEWSDAVEFELGQSGHVDLFRRGRFVAIELQSLEDYPEGFQVGAIEVDAVEAGRW